MTESLTKVVNDYAHSDAIRFHMPGHNGTDLNISTSMDITELSFSDNLISASGIIADTQSLIADSYDMNFALMLTAGATSGIAIALYCASLHGNSIAIVGDAHKSVYNYANIFSLKVVNVSNEIELKNIKNLAAVIITSPNYFGDTLSHSEYKGNHLLIIDQSHGAHFAFSSKLPSISSDADIVITSWHKTLPVLTGGAVISCNEKLIYNQLLLGRDILHTSSPNYMIMSSIDSCVRHMKLFGEDLYNNVINSINEFKINLNCNYKLVTNSDPTRLVISTKGENANTLASILEKNNIFIEMSYADKIVAIITPYNHQHLTKFCKTLNSITLKNTNIFSAEFLLLTSEIFNEKTARLIALNESEGMVCMTSIGIYPPGVPLIKKGQIISNEIIAYLESNINNIFGLIHGKILACENN